MSNNFKPLAEQISEKMIAGIRSGKSIFQKPMNDDATSQFMQPFNPTTGYNFKGPTALILLMQNRNDPRWMSSDQANYNHTAVIKGSTGTLTNTFAKYETKPVLGEDGQPKLKANDQPETQRVKLVKPMLVDAWLFNGQQIRNLPEWEPEQQVLSPAQRAEKIVENSKAVFQAEETVPHYSPQTDVIYMPEKEEFSSAELYYAAALHELAHWTGHENRLNRAAENEPGSDKFIKEELRANIASILISAELNLPYDIGDHIGYLNAWSQVMKEDPNELFKATSDAQKIAHYVLKFENEIGKKLEVETPREISDKLSKGDVIPYNGTEYKVLSELKNKVYQMQDLGTSEKFKMSAKDGLFNSLLEAKNNPQEKSVDHEKGIHEPSEAEEEDNTYQMEI